MCSILDNRENNKLNRNLTNIIREYLLPIKEYTYHPKTLNIESLYFYLIMKRKYVDLSVYRSDFFADTILMVYNNNKSSFYMNVYDFPYCDICRIENENIREILYDRKNWNNDHINS